MLAKVPLIKSIYRGLRDFMDYATRLKEQDDIQKVIFVHFSEARLVGFIIGAKQDFKPTVIDEKDMITVYLPMSYQIGGFTVHVPKDRVEPLGMSVEDAMRIVLTAGMSKRRKSEAGR